MSKSKQNNDLNKTLTHSSLLNPEKSLNSQVPFIPLTVEEVKKLGWNDGIDVLLITGDAYVDHPSYGISVIGRILLEQGYKVAMIAQPDWKNVESLTKFGRPKLGCAVTSGNMDSMVNIYTAARRLRKDDVYSVNGETGNRPAHALVVYSQLCRRAFPGTKVVIGGLEASLRRIAHYDYWQDKLRHSILVDSKADILSYSMGEHSMTRIFERIANGESLHGIRGTATLLGKNAANEFKNSIEFNKYLALPSWQDMTSDKKNLMVATKLIEQEMNPYCGHGLTQEYGDRLLVIEPSPLPLTTKEMDEVHDLPFAYSPHPLYGENVRIPAFETIKNSIPAVRGCPGGCAFCGLVSHQGRLLSKRSRDSVMREVDKMCGRNEFRGTISDIGGPAGNIYGNKAKDENVCAKCRRSSCLFPRICPNYNHNADELVQLLKDVRNHSKVKHVYINSGIRLELALRQKELTKELLHHHTSGHMKVAPEHLNNKVLRLMRKNPAEDFYKFKKVFEEISKEADKEQYLIPLFISNFPGCTEEDMKTVDNYLDSENWSPQQVQDYIPLPMTMGAAMYYSGIDSNFNEISVMRGLKERRTQMNMLKKKRKGSKFYGKNRDFKHKRNKNLDGRNSEQNSEKNNNSHRHKFNKNRKKN
ncbi:YgiQ family radical SAM protein [Lentisphaerota bacterium WC36G]|nr:YgiQ family radical SAM protein [Lentisphaerae bacterium WC36]